MSNLIAALLLSAATAVGAAQQDVVLWGTDGAPRPLAVDRGRPAILFYEDRGSHRWNEPLKAALITRGRARGLLDRVQVIAVANIAAYDFFPAREIALRYLRRVEAEAGVPILVDLRGVLARPPWNLPDAGAAVVVLDARGAAVFERRGRLSRDDVEATLATLGRLVGERGS